MAERVLGDGLRCEKLQQIIWPAGLGADTGEFSAPEGLTLDDSSRNPAVYIEVAHLKFSAGLVDVGRRKVLPELTTSQPHSSRSGPYHDIHYLPDVGHLFQVQHQLHTSLDCLRR